MNKCVYVIFVPNYNNSIGGNLALHSLSENLSLLGEEVYITCQYKREHSLTKSIDIKSNFWSFLSKENTIVVYPEIIENNPLNAKHICRWLLNNPGAFKKFDAYEPEGIFFRYNKYFNYEKYDKEIPVLNTYISKVKTFTPLQNKNIKRKRIIYSLRKINQEKLKRYPIKTEWELIHFNSIDKTIFDLEIRNIFRNSKYYISYDHCSYMTVLAALCGCIPIVIPDERYSKEEWKNIFPIQRYGVAYGFEDIEFAKETLHLVKDNVIEVQKSSFQSILDFNEYWYKKLFNIKFKSKEREEKLINAIITNDLRDLVNLEIKEFKEKRKISKILKIKLKKIIFYLLGYKNCEILYRFFRKTKNLF